MKALVLVSMLFVLSGCFLTQSKPQPQTPQVQGALLLEDIQGIELAGPIHGGLAAGLFVANNVNGVKSFGAHAFNHFARKSTDYATAECTKSVEKYVPSRGSFALISGIVDAGKISFGPALLGTLTDLVLNADKIYEKSLDPGMDKGAYDFIGEGSMVVPKFNVSITMPEILSNARVSGYSLIDGGYLVRRDLGMIVTWKAMDIVDEANVVSVSIKSVVGGEKTTVSCEVAEKVFVTGALEYIWEFPASIMAHVPASTKTEINIVRGQYTQTVSKTPSIILAGARIQTGTGEIQ